MRFVAYLRVSTESQNVSGLGLEAQERAVAEYVARIDGAEILQTVVEVESGKNNKRPKIAEALRLCRVYGATLLIAKIDRLARNVAFVSTLMESGAEFVAVDFPQANRLTVHILASMAEFEREQISLRTKAGLESAKRRGVKLGNPQNLKPCDEGRATSLANRQRKAAEFKMDVLPTIREIQAAGKTTLAAIADELNKRKAPTRRKGAWTPVQVRRVLLAA